MPVRVTYHELKECFWALYVERKGATAEVVKWFCDTLQDSGRGGNEETGNNAGE